MARTAACPSCGAPVEFRSAASILAVCEYCRTTLARSDEAIENLGRMGELLPDNSPLQIGAEGRASGRHFAVVGRIQLRYDEGMWNEWHLLFDDGRSGWLSEAGGEYVLSFLKWVPDVLPQFDQARVGDSVWIDGIGFSITNILSAECIAGAGELPFKVGSGYPAPLIDLRSGQHFASIDFSDGKPLVFIGGPVAFADLGWNNLRVDLPLPQIDEKGEALQCPQCGGQIELHSPEIASVACPHCASVSDLYAGKLKLWARARGAVDAAPWLKLGSSGNLLGESLTVIGALVRKTTAEGIDYFWREYLLLNEQRQFRWLTEYNGHWTLVRVLSAPPRATGSRLADVMHEGLRYEHFEGADAEVVFVLGEFNWKVRVGERVQCDDYIHPPFILSCERNDREATWSAGEYLAMEDVRDAFRLPAPPPPQIGVGACQPSPVAERHRQVCRRYWQFAGVALLIQILSAVFVGEHELLQQTLSFDPGNDESLVSREFRVASGPAKLTVRNSTNLSNNWAELGITLVNKTASTAWSDGREVSYYSGVDSDGSWTEGSRDSELVFRDLPAGTYMLVIDPELSPETRAAIHDNLQVVEGERVWSSFVLVLIALGLFPLFTRWRVMAFEIRRWADSDHPKVTSSDDDD